ncbi:MAG: cell division protein FtsA [Methylacidiphilales bacterium]|nr:cell division protein FtsA [Candidatus Methylacidiphilales bacterium]
MFWGKSRNLIVALEVGSTKVAAAVGEIRSDGTLALLGIGEASSGQVRKCEIVDFEVAQGCVRDALAEAEQKTDVVVAEVYLAISGAHIQSSNTRVTTVINSDSDEITQEHVQELHDMATAQPLPSGHAIVHHLLQHYVLDDGTVTDNPMGLASRQLTAHFHQVFGMATRLQTTIRCVKELSIDVKNYALSSYATAQAVLTRNQKQLGAVVINLGGGVSDYIVYQKGAVVHTGVLGVGGDHLTNDIVSGLKIPYAKAELLKRGEGSVILDPGLDDSDRITLPGAYNFEERQIHRSSLNTIMQARQAEIFEIILEDLQNASFWPDFAGTVYITGGASQVNGLVELASQIFPCPVELAHQSPFDGDQTYGRRPDLSTVLGLLQYARQAELELPSARGFARVGQTLRRALASMRLI